MPNGDGWLNGWKEICSYIGCAKNTAKKFKKQYGMPTHYLPTGQIIAIKNELDKWIILFDRKKRLKTMKIDSI